MPEPLPATPRDFATPTALRQATLLAVEDSRYSCEVLRLYCRQLGLRLRRAADLATARAHLRLYRPDIALVDLDLPDGRGEDLIAQMVAGGHRPGLIIATSGDDSARTAALAAGADVFLDKPLPDLVEFRGFLVDHFPTPLPMALLPNRPFRPETDALALHDDLALAARGFEQARDLRFLSGFVAGIAGTAGDSALRDAAIAGPSEFRQLRDIVNERLRAIEERL